MTPTRDIYINRTSHISIQAPTTVGSQGTAVDTSQLAQAGAVTSQELPVEILLEFEPRTCPPSIDPDFKQWFTAGEARRLGKVLKRAAAVAAMATEGLAAPVDAIFTATGLGCVKNTELFLTDMTFGGENLLKPTQFMQSTHNTLGSLIAIRLGCHGGNVTYANGDISFESTLLDAVLQLGGGEIETALVTAFDEMTPAYFDMLCKSGYYGPDLNVPAGEVAMASVVSTTPTASPLCRITSLDAVYWNDLDDLDFLASFKPGMIYSGDNGMAVHHELYEAVMDKYFDHDIPCYRYKTVTGETMTASALCVAHAAARLAADPSIGSILCLNIRPNIMGYVMLQTI